MASKLIHTLFKSRNFKMKKKENNNIEDIDHDNEMVEITEEENNFDEDVDKVLHPDAKEGFEAQLNELKDKYLRLVAEFDNFRKRTARERVDLEQLASRNIVTALLPVLDDFERARKIAEEPNSPEPFSEGVQLVFNKLNLTLQNKGLKVVLTDGQPFDPELHEAITEIEMGDGNKGKIIDTVERGYTLNDHIIKYAKVVVGK